MTKLQQLYNWCEGEKREDMDSPDQSPYKGEQYIRETIARENHNNALSTVQEKIKELNEK